MAKNNERKSHHEDKSSDFEEKVLYINRCATVTKGGRKFSFSALILVGDGKGNIGFGFSKANEVSDAIKKGSETARKNLFTFEREGTTIPHEIRVNYDGASLLLKPAPVGTGVVAGSKIRAVLELAGIRDVVAKSLGSNNPINQVRATIKALLLLRNRKKCFADRGLTE